MSGGKVMSTQDQEKQKLQQQVVAEFEYNAEYLRIMTNETRQKIVALLGSHLEEGLTTKDIQTALRMSPMGITNNLNKLVAIKLVSKTRSGNQDFYFLSLDETILRLERLVAAIKASYPYSASARLTKKRSTITKHNR